jgi:myo-inositol-1(or 4)-monophosphatase
MVGTGFPFKSLPLLPRYTEGFAAMVRAGAAIRRAGAAAIDLCYLAEGRFDAFWELHLLPWDFAAGGLIVVEAGGTMATVEGDALRLRPGSVAGASSPALLEEMLGVVQPGG